MTTQSAPTTHPASASDLFACVTADRGHLHALRALLRCVPVLLGILVLPALASAHDTWISRKQFRDPASGAWCCDEHDCSPLDDQDILRDGAGFIINGQHFVADQRVLPSGDEHFWACFNDEGTGPHDRVRNVRCLFVPMNS